MKPINGSLRTVLVVEPQRLVRQALVAAIDAAVIAARSLGHSWVGLLQAGPSCVDDVPVWHVEASPTDQLLSVREAAGLGTAGVGREPAQAARALDITTYTVRDHIKSIRAKLDRPTTMSAVLEAIRLGLLQVEQA